MQSVAPPSLALDDSKSNSTSKRSLLLLGILCVLMLAPFAGRPFHIDDPMFIWTAQHIVHHPLDFYGYSTNWLGRESPVSEIIFFPPLAPYFLAAVSRLVGWQEVLLHLAYLPFGVLSIVGVYLLADRFCRRPALCALLFMLCPGFWVSSNTLMCEPPLICFWIWAVLFWIWGAERSPWLLLLSALVGSAAVLTKFTALGLVPLLFLHAALKPARPRVRVLQAASLFFIILTAIGYDIVFAHLYGASAFGRAAEYTSKAHAILGVPAITRTIDTLVFIGGGGLTACLFLLLVAWPARASIIAFLAATVLALVMAYSVSPPTGWARPAGVTGAHFSGASFAFYSQFTILLVLGAAAVIHSGKALLRRWRVGSWREELFLFSWMAGIFVFAGYLNWTINVRSILPMIPPMCIVIVRGLDRVNRLPLVRATAALLLGGALALMVTIADYQQAVVAKTAAGIIAREAASLNLAAPGAVGPRLWFVGHWGFQYYMQAADFVELDSHSPQFRTGDYIIVPAIPYGGTVRGAGFALIRNITVGGDHWVATAQPNMGAGFYDTNSDDLPFAFGPMPADSFSLVQVTPSSVIFP